MRYNKILVRGYAGHKPFADEIEYQPYIFMPSKKGDFRTLDGRILEKKKFKDIVSAREFEKTNADISNSEYFGNTNWMYQFIHDEFPRNGKIKYDPSLISLVYTDIEVDHKGGFPSIEKADREITAINLMKNDDIILFGIKYYKPSDPNVKYVLCKDENDLLEKFLFCWNSEDWTPDIISGWNIEGFDIPYLYNRIKRVLGEKSAKMLSPWRLINEKKVFIAGREMISYDFVGIQVLDYINIYKKFSYTNQESYTLNHIAHVELGEKKIDYSEYEDLNELYEKNPEKFYDYNIHDSRLVSLIEKKRGIIKQIMFLAYDAQINFVDTMGTVKPWDVIITNYLIDQKIAVPQFKMSDDDTQIMGGYVKEPKLGLSKWVVTFDYTSLYPKIIESMNISPETLVKKIFSPVVVDNDGDRYIDLNGTKAAIEKANVKDYAIAGNGCLFSREKQGFFPALMEKMYMDRFNAQKRLKEVKKELAVKSTPELENERVTLDTFQLGRKIQLNSGYGAMANKYFRFFNNDMAEAVTSTGQFAIQFSEDKINTYLNKIMKTKDKDYIVAIDTDSVHIEFNDLVKECGLENEPPEKVVKFLEKVCKEKIEPYLQKCYDEFCSLTNAFANRFHMKLEQITDRAIWRKKKNYVMNVLYSGYYHEPELLMHGIEAVRSSTPMACRKKIKEALMIIMRGKESDYHKLIKEFREEFFELPFEEIASPRSMNHMNKYKDKTSVYIKGTPIQIKGALVYNFFMKELGLTNKYELIHNGSKIKYCYLTTPNPVKCSVIAVPNRLPLELGLDKYLDRDLQFFKTFLSPIQSIASLMNWSDKPQNSLRGFFT